MSIKERLNAIADALETASKQARLLAGEVEDRFSCTITGAKIAKAQQRLNRRVWTQATNDIPQEAQPQKDSSIPQD